MARAAGCVVSLFLLLSCQAGCVHTVQLGRPPFSSSFRERLTDALRSLQFPPAHECGCRRILVYSGHYYEGFACAVHQMGLAQLVALATNRTLVVPAIDHWGYVPGSDCSSRNWDCVFEPLSSCSDGTALTACSHALGHLKGVIVDSMQDMAVLEGPARIVELYPRGSTSKHGSVHRNLFAPAGPLQQWLASAGGTFRLRAEVQVQVLQRQQGLRLGYLAAHVRASDNLANTRRDFGIDPSTYSVAAFLPRLRSLDGAVKTDGHGGLAEHKQQGKTPVFIATDTTHVITHLQHWQRLHGDSESIRFVFDKGSTSRAPGKDRLLRKANRKDKVPSKQVSVLHLTRDIVATISLLGHAEALVGSQISNVFRLAAELHCAWSDYKSCAALLTGRDSNSTATGSVWTVDVPWYQDP